VNAVAPALNLAPLLDVQGVCKSFRKPDGDQLVVLENVNLTLRPGEIVGLLGRSGSGKSTLLRVIAGLDDPSGGVVNYLGEPVSGPASRIAMVFQSFALFPWLTVLENVQLGLEALGVPEAEMRKRSLQAIDLIGLDGFESAYPRELSGGMRQRVGFARALVVHPNILPDGRGWMSGRATAPLRAVSSTSSRTTWRKRRPSRRCAPSSPGAATRSCSRTTTIARLSAWRIRLNCPVYGQSRG